jgi:signal transduction histidine kinase
VNALQRLAACVIVAAIAVSLHGNAWPALWFVGLVAVLTIDRTIFQRLATRLAAGEATPMRGLIAWMVVQSTYANIMAAMLWFAPEGPGVALAFMYMCAGIANAAATLRSSPVLAVAGAGPTIACMLGLPVVEFFVGGARDSLTLMPLAAALLFLGFGANLWRSLAASDHAVARAEAAAISQRRAEATAAAARAETFARVARDLRTPLAALASAAEGVRRAGQQPSAPLAALLQASDVVAAAIRDLSALDAPNAAAEPTDLRTLLRALAGAFRTAALDKRLELFVDVSAATPTLVYIDAAKVRRILYKLVDNAIRHTVHGGVRVRLRVAQDSAADAIRLEILVADTGVGISRAHLALLIADADAADHPSGLAATIRMARALGGELTVQSELGEGALFKLALTATLVAPVRAEAA